MSEKDKGFLTIALSVMFIGVGLGGVIMLALFKLGYVVIRG